MNLELSSAAAAAFDEKDNLPAVKHEGGNILSCRDTN